MKLNRDDLFDFFKNEIEEKRIPLMNVETIERLIEHSSKPTHWTNEPDIPDDQIVREKAEGGIRVSVKERL